MAVKMKIAQTLIEGSLVLLLVAIDRVGRANSRRTKPDHVIVPRLSQFIRGRTLETVAQSTDAGSATSGYFYSGVLYVDQEPIVGPRSRDNQFGAGLQRQRAQASLLHYADNVTE